MRRQFKEVPGLRFQDLKISRIIFEVAGILLVSTFLLFPVPLNSQYVRVPVESCPENFAFVNGVCLHHIETQKIPVCPEGFVSKGSECYSAEPLLKECPTGFQMQDKQCVREIFAQQEKLCPSGLKLDFASGKCYYEEEINPICPPGSIDFRDSCATVREPSRICQDPLKLDPTSSLCIERNATLPIAVCPESFVFDFDLGICIQETIEEKICPDGFLEVDENNCGNWTLPEYGCPNGTQPENVKNQSLCRSFRYFNSTLECPPGTFLENQLCLSNNSINSKSCPPGFIETEDRCLKYQEPILHCPHGFKKVSKNGTKICINTINVDPEISCPSIYSFFDESTRLCIQEKLVEKECPPNSFRSKDSCLQKVRGEWDCPPGASYDSETHTCQEVLTIEPNIICPPKSNFDQFTFSCIAYNKNLQVCPPGYEEVGESECASFLPPKRSCPNPLSLVEGQCEEIVLTPPETLCPSGSQLVDSTCIMKSDKAPKRKCPPESLDSGDHCLVLETPEKQCIEGYNYDLQKEKCIKISSRSPDISCREPGTLTPQGECIFTEVLPRICPPNSKEDPTNENFCLTKTKSKPVCPEGYIFFEENCIKEEIREVELNCPGGYKFNEHDGSCHKLIQRTQICPPGFLDDGEECFVSSKPISVCPKEFGKESSLGDCIKINLSDSISQCPTGTLEVPPGLCGARIPLPIKYLCQKGTKVGDSCVVETFLDASYECPPGYYLSEAKQCQKLVEYDCSEVTIVPVSCTHLNSINTATLGGFNLERSPGSCSQAVRTQKTCSRTEAFPPKVSCPAGSVNIGKECLRKEHLPMIRVCSDRSKTLENCFQESMVPRIDVCPLGSSMTEDKKCTSIVRKAPELVCREGFVMEEGNCIRRTSKVCPPEGCTSLNVIEPTQECPSGFNLKGKNCTFRHQIPPSKVCERGELSNSNKGICFERVFKSCVFENCEQITREPPNLGCREDETLNSQTKKCEKVTIGPQMLKCSKPFKLVGEQCVHQVSKECSGENCSVSISTLPLLSCKQGTLISSKQCETIKRSPSLLSCPREFTLEEDQCVKYVNKECLNGQCEKKVHYPPIVECPYQYSSTPRGGCSKKIHHLPQIRCPLGSSLLNSYCVKQVEQICPAEGCTVKETSFPMVKCPSGFHKDMEKFQFGGSACIKELYDHGEILCPEGSFLFNGSCITHSVKECFQNDCEKSKTTSPKKICPPGTELDSNGFCRDSEIFPREMKCPSGYFLKGDKCILYKEKTCQHKNCKSQITLEPEIACPEGFYLDRAICIREKYHPTQSSCPQNSFMMNGQCFSLVKKECPNNSCESKILLDPVFACPKGFAEIGDKCIRLEYSGHKKLCPPGLVLKKNHCLRFTGAELRCPGGFKEEGEKCIKEVKTETIITYDSQCVGNHCNSSYGLNKYKHHDHTHKHKRGH
ncbi:oocyst wall protein 2 [Cryptosporidium felis]|nr:oocyst wall protein 2 [Cryptosporidium felis]